MKIHARLDQNNWLSRLNVKVAAEIHRVLSLFLTLALLARQSEGFQTAALIRRTLSLTPGVKPRPKTFNMSGKLFASNLYLRTPRVARQHLTIN